MPGASGSVLERTKVRTLRNHGEFDRTHLQNLMVDAISSISSKEIFRKALRLRLQAGIGGADVHIRIDIAAISLHTGRNGDGGGIRTAAFKRRHAVVRPSPWKPATTRNLPHFHAARFRTIDFLNTGCAMALSTGSNCQFCHERAHRRRWTGARSPEDRSSPARRKRRWCRILRARRRRRAAPQTLGMFCTQPTSRWFYDMAETTTA